MDSKERIFERLETVGLKRKDLEKSAIGAVLEALLDIRDLLAIALGLAEIDNESLEDDSSTGKTEGSTKAV